MNSNNDLENKHNLMSEIEEENSLSIEEFIKQLEAKEKDLHISTDLAIEIEESDFDDTNPADFIKAEFGVAPAKVPPSPVQNSAPQNGEKLIELENELSQARRHVNRVETERAELVETMRRRQNDFENYKKRIERDRGESFINQVGNLAIQMLPVLDNLDRALDFAESHHQANSKDFHQFFEGIVMVNQQLNEVLVNMGVSPIASVGEPFNPHFHEAVATEENAAIPPNTVTSEFLRGYRIGDKVIRAAMVRVSTAGRPATAVSNFSEADLTDPEDDFLEA